MISLYEFLQAPKQLKFVEYLENKYAFISEVENNQDKHYDDWGSEILVVNCDIENLNELTDSDFLDFCHKMQWIPTFAIKTKRDNVNVVQIYLEPISKNKKHFDTCYHITTRKLYDNFISKQGLKVKGTIYRKWFKEEIKILRDESIYKNDRNSYNRTPGYRSITPRIYVFTKSDEYDFEEIYYQIKKDEEQVVLKIDLSKHKNIMLYKDNANADELPAYYTLENIPASLISIDEELTKKLEDI